MSISATGLARQPGVSEPDRTTTILRQMTASQLQQLGVPHLAYVNADCVDAWCTLSVLPMGNRWRWSTISTLR